MWGRGVQGAEAWVRKERGMCDEGGEGIGEERRTGMEG